MAAGVAHWPAPFRNVVDDGVPDDARRATGTVPLEMFVAFSDVRPAPEPTNAFAVTVPAPSYVKFGDPANVPELLY